MKLALIFLMSVLVVTTQHQYFHDQTVREMPWLFPYSVHHQLDQAKQQPILIDSSKSIHPAIDSSQKENFNRDDVAYLPGDTQPRVKDLNEQQANGGRYLFNLFSSTGTYINSLFKTATFTSTLSVSLTSVVNCVPSNQMLNGAAATACARKRRRHLSSISDDVHLQENQFSIAPSEILKLLPTEIYTLPDEDSVHQLSSSQNDVIEAKMLTSSRNSREQRFLFANKNQLVVSTTVTSYALVNTTITVTRNLLNPIPDLKPGGKCATAAGAIAQCVNCLPAGYIVCPASG